MQRRRFDRLVHQREAAQHVGEFVFRQAVDVGDDAIQLGAQAGACGRVSCAVVVAAQADLGGEVVEFGRGADELGGAADDGVEEGVGWCEAGDGELVAGKTSLGLRC